MDSHGPLRPPLFAATGRLNDGIGKPTLVILFLLLVLGLLTGPPPARASGMFMVNSPQDTNVKDAVLTLREALLVDNGALLGPFSNEERDLLAGCLFTGTNNNWTISGGCGLGFGDDILILNSMTIHLTGNLPTLSDSGTFVQPSPGAVVEIDGGASAGNIFVVTGQHIVIAGLRLYGSLGSIIWLQGNSAPVTIADNVIGDDDPAEGGCGQSANAVAGIKVTDDSGAPARAFIYGNVIECIAGNPGDGIAVTAGARDLFIGANELLIAGSAQRNRIGYNARDGVHFDAPSGYSAIRNSTIHQNGRDGIFLRGTFFVSVFGTIIEHNERHGVELDAAHSNIIGCAAGVDPTSDDYRNHIRLNGASGVRLGSSTDNLITCNRIGVGGPDGGQPAGNEESGILIEGSQDNQVGAEGNGFGNIISGNAWDGLTILNSQTNDIYNNIIGLNAGGSRSVANGGDGIYLGAGADQNIIGGDVAAWQGNIISGNAGYGVAIVTAHANILENNYIGLAANGSTPVPNGVGGVLVSDGNANSIGTLTSGTRQVISGNGGHGITLRSGGYSLVGLNTLIGTTADGTGAAGNQGAGILMVDGASDSAIFPLVVAHNGGAGIILDGNDSVNNVITPESVFGNGGMAIDLGNDGHTANDPGDGDVGPNDLLNYPEVTSTSGSQVGGTACPGCKVLIYEAIGDPSRPGGGGVFLSNVTADAIGLWTALLPGERTVDEVTFLACEAPCFLNGQSSEMSPRPLDLVIFLPAVLRE